MTPGQIAYHAYCEQVEWTSVRNEVLPDWLQQSKRTQKAWECAASAIMAAMLRGDIKVSGAFRYPKAAGEEKE